MPLSLETARALKSSSGAARLLVSMFGSLPLGLSTLVSLGNVTVSYASGGIVFSQTLGGVGEEPLSSPTVRVR